jgi:hypothetical protein
MAIRSAESVKFLLPGSMYRQISLWGVDKSAYGGIMHYFFNERLVNLLVDFKLLLDAPSFSLTSQYVREYWEMLQIVADDQLPQNCIVVLPIYCYGGSLFHGMSFGIRRQ